MVRLSELTDNELISLAQKETDRFKKCIASAQQTADEYGFSISESENNILNIIYAKLKEKRDNEKKKQRSKALNKWYKHTLDNIYKLDYEAYLELVNFQGNDNDFVLKFAEIFLKYNLPKFNPDDYKTPSGRTVTTCLRVTFPNGQIISHRKSVDTLVEVIEMIGPEKIAELDMICCGIPFLTQEYLASTDNTRSIRQNAVAGGWYVSTNTSNQKKKEQIEYISSALNLGLTIEIVEKDSVS